MGVEWSVRPVIIVTGANGCVEFVFFAARADFSLCCRGIGFSICHRLLVQLAQHNPPDAQPQRYATRRLDLEHNAKTGGAADFRGLAGCDTLTLVLACRNVQKAEAARKELLGLLDIEVERLKRSERYDGHAERFRKNLEIVVRCLDLASMDSIFKFARRISSEYASISSLPYKRV